MQGSEKLQASGSMLNVRDNDRKYRWGLNKSGKVDGKVYFLQVGSKMSDYQTL